MKIVILGAGAVGSTLANLCHKKMISITVDNDPVKLHKLEEEADIRTILGGSSFQYSELASKMLIWWWPLQV